MTKKLPKGWHSWYMKPLRFLVDFFVPYTWAYQIGFTAGMEKTDYFKGMAEGQRQTHEFYWQETIWKKHRKRKVSKK